MTTLRFTATPLTPIHVGDGTTLVPEDYLLAGDELIRFNRSTVLRDMAPAVRRELEDALDKNRFERAQEMLRGACDPRSHALGRIGISNESRQALQTLVAHPESPVRQREVHPFLRNPISGRPVVAGSSIKGAIRTAIVNQFTQKHLPAVKAAVCQADVRRQAQTLETEALNYEFGRLESDPLRLLKVADAELPDGCTRIDRALQFKLDQGFNDIQMHYERLLSRGDGETLCFGLELELDDSAIANERVRALIGRELSFDLIRQACNTFYIGRMLAEHKRFFHEDTAPEARYGAQGLVKFQGEKLLVAKSLRDEGILLRIGRFSHFESLSVDELRQGWNIQRKKPIEEGSTRTLCRSARISSSAPMPFGWLMLRSIGSESG